MEYTVSPVKESTKKSAIPANKKGRIEQVTTRDSSVEINLHVTRITVLSHRTCEHDFEEKRKLGNKVTGFGSQRVVLRDLHSNNDYRLPGPGKGNKR